MKIRTFMKLMSTYIPVIAYIKPTVAETSQWRPTTIYKEEDVFPFVPETEPERLNGVFCNPVLFTDKLVDYTDADVKDIIFGLGLDLDGDILQLHCFSNTRTAKITSLSNYRNMEVHLKKDVHERLKRLSRC